TAKPAGRDIDQHQVHRPTAQQVFRRRSRPTRQCHLPAVAATHPRPVQRHLAAMEADLALGLAPTMSGLAIFVAIARAAQLDRVLLHHPAQGAHPCRQAETLETGTNLLPGFANRCLWHTDRGLSTLAHGVALLCGFDTPSLPAQGGQRRLESFNKRRDIPATPAATLCCVSVGCTCSPDLGGSP